MARPKKDSVAVTVKMDREVFDILSKFIESSGQSKTLAIERAIRMYVADYERRLGSMEITAGAEETR